MATAKKLFDFIKSLTSNEKRYFRLQTSLQTGKKNYSTLFEAIDAMENYDKALLIKEFGDEKFVKNLHVTENYLFNRLLESLRTFHADKSIVARINNLLLDAELLKKKGFYELSLKKLKKAEKIALKNHKHFFLSEILPLKIDLIASTKQKKIIELVDDLYHQAVENYRRLQEENKYIYLHYWFLLVFRKWRQPKDEAILEKMEEGMQLVADRGYPKDGTFKTKYYYYTIQSIYYQIKRNYLAGNKIHEKIIEVWESHPEMIKYNLSVYMARLANYINNCITNGLHEKAQAIIDKLETLSTKNYDEEGEKFQNVYFYKQYCLLSTHQFEEAQKLIPAIEKGMKKYATKINFSRELAFYYNTTINLFLVEEYEQALEWLDKILSVTRTAEPRKDLQRIARILQLAIHYMLGNRDTLEYMFRSVYRNKKLKKEMHLFEKTVLTYFKKLLKVAPSSREEQWLLQGFKEELNSLASEQKKTTGFEEFSIWLEQVTNDQLSKEV